ncbi:hypothetical protein DDZ18_02400 [Marinicauda salina]|uniref:Uncharacterized protein n=1 Tax=Marinicauda salina TaxID=2135793 RepID=A0A2U2BWS9_9PROT|nr:lysylphosphatidylglycerol synthase domain-containing protein [Marinicauda salina]PWE18476.1 hypothetical protein DDZ18_02400 [Marinicauda salina]
MVESSRRRASITRRTWPILAAAGLAAALLAGLVAFSGLSIADFKRGFADAPLWPLGLVVAGTAVQTWAGAVKWRAVMRRLVPSGAAEPALGYFVFYTALTGVFSQAMTPYLAGAAVRGFATRRHQKTDFWRGATGSGFEQLFDAGLIVALAVPALIVLVAGGGLAALGLALAAGAFAGRIALGVFLVHPLWRGGLERWLTASRLSPLRAFGRVLRGADEAGLFEKDIVARLYRWSLIRYVAIGLRPLAVALMIAPASGLPGVAAGFPLVQASQFAAITPGNLGVAEWGWTAVLAASGWDFETATVFALAVRVLSLAALFLVFLGAALAFLRTRRARV